MAKTPVQEMLYQMMGIERFGLDYYERRDLFDSLYHTMCERYDELFDIAAGSPVEMILMGDNISGDDDHLPDREIAAKVGVNTATLTRWKLHPEFRARVAQEREDLLRRLRHTTLRDKDARIAQLEHLNGLLWDIITERSKSEFHRRSAGGETGLVIRTERRVPTGNGRCVVNVREKADVALSAEIRASLEQIAKEMGQ
ncbi:MAG: hypothetical protein M0Z94_13895, partial [Dehalococcoidales bacterium]|nr:hypothetical protein [Dehalococcoidales bacterium]